MNLEFDKQDEAFRSEVRDWLATHAPLDWSDWMSASREQVMAWEQTLAQKGWLAPGWPAEYGGPGWTTTQRYIWDEECARINAPRPSIFGHVMCGPVIMAFGTDQQKAEHLPPIANGTRIWCQGYSEPGAGSDLASLKTRADRDGDDYVVNGQKIWTTWAHKADWIFCLVRTSREGRPQEGVSFLLIDLNTSGIEIRPIHTIDGEHHLNEVFFRDVRVPVANRVGEEGQGWTIAKFLLNHERSSVGGSSGSKVALAQLKGLIDSDPALRDNPAWGKRLADLEIDLLALEYTNLRALEKARSGESPGSMPSVLKLQGTEIQQALSELRVEMGGYASLPWKADPVGEPAFATATQIYNFGRAFTIYGGSSEVQKNIMAKFALGL